LLHKDVATTFFSELKSSLFARSAETVLRTSTIRE